MNGDDGNRMTGSDMDPAQIRLELSLMEKKFEMLDDRERKIERLCSEWLANKKISKETQTFINEVTRILKSKPKKWTY